MAEFVLTTGSRVTCPHQGAASPIGLQSVLVIGGAPALVQGDFTGVSVAGCTNATNSGTGAVQCSLMGSATQGVSTLLRASGKAVLLASLSGILTGAVQTAAAPAPLHYSATANESLVETA